MTESQAVGLLIAVLLVLAGGTAIGGMLNDDYRQRAAAMLFSACVFGFMAWILVRRGVL